MVIKYSRMVNVEYLTFRSGQSMSAVVPDMKSIQ